MWVKIGGIPDDLLHYKGICEAGSPLGVVQMIDVPALSQYRVARVKVGVRDTNLIPPSTDITTDPYVYDAYYEMEEVVEKGGLLDENGEIIEGVPQSHLMDVDNDSPNKKRKWADVEGDVSQCEESGKEGFFITKEKLMQYIKDETKFRVGFELQRMEERLLAAQLRNNMGARQGVEQMKEKENPPSKDKSVFEEDGDDFFQSYSIGDNLEEETEAMNETREEVMDKNNAADLEAKKCIKEKTMKAAEEENIRKRLRSQGDLNMMDKAEDLASKKNLDKGNALPSVLNSFVSSLCDLADKMKINIGHDIEKKMQMIDIIKKLEDARYSIYVETIKSNRNTNKMDEENCQAPLDMSSLMPLLTKDDEGIGELDESLEISVSPKGTGSGRKITEPISVKPKIRFKLGRKNNEKSRKMRGRIWNGRGVGASDKRKHIRELVADSSLDFNGIQETQLEEVRDSWLDQMGSRKEFGWYVL
jgi:hypothetical protein